jgi:hypothetical protein
VPAKKYPGDECCLAEVQRERLLSSLSERKHKLVNFEGKEKGGDCRETDSIKGRAASSFANEERSRPARNKK